MKFNMLKNIFPKKSVLNKNKWLLLAIVVLVCVGLYWYSRKNRENFEKYEDGYVNLNNTNNVELNRTLYTDKNVEVKNFSYLKNEHAGDLNIYTRTIKDVYVKGLNEGCTLNERWRTANPSGMNGDVTKDAINTQDFYKFFLDKKSNENMFVTTLDKPKCNDYNIDFNEIIDGTYEDGMFPSYKKALQELERTNLYDDAFSTTDFVTNTMNETITVFVADGCTASEGFLTNIWTQDLTDYLLENYPFISLNVEKCEVLKKGTDGRIQDSMCKFSGLFSTTTKESKLAYPLIQYSVLLQTKNLGEGKYSLHQENFDPTKIYDKINDEPKLMDEDLDPTNNNNPKTRYSAKKIKDWVKVVIPPTASG